MYYYIIFKMFFLYIALLMCSSVAQWLALFPHSKSWVQDQSLGFLRVLRLPPTIQKVWLIGYSKLSVGVNVSVNGCFSLYVGPVME